MKPTALLLVIGLAVAASPASADDLSIVLVPDRANPAAPQMGDTLSFHSAIRNDGQARVDGLIAWPSIVRIDKGEEKPVGLEDWSAEKAATASSLAPGETLRTDWPMRLIQAGHYRLVVSAASRSGDRLTASPFADFTVRRKPVVESQRVLPVAFGVPLLIGLALAWRRYASRRGEIRT